LQLHGKISARLADADADPGIDRDAGISASRAEHLPCKFRNIPIGKKRLNNFTQLISRYPTDPFFLIFHVWPDFCKPHT